MQTLRFLLLLPNLQLFVLLIAIGKIITILIKIIMPQMILGVFPTRDKAENAITRLQENGFNPKDISIIMKDPGSNETINTNADNPSPVAQGFTSGVATGGVIGALAGLLIGVGAIVVPGIGGLLIGGPIAAALGLTGAAASTVSGAATGVLAGGLIGALTGMGIPESDARTYQEEISRGAILVAVPVETGNNDVDVENILRANGAAQISRFNTA